MQAKADAIQAYVMHSLSLGNGRCLFMVEPTLSSPLPSLARRCLVVVALLRMPPVFLTHLTQMCQKSQSGLDDGGNEDDCGLQLLSRSGATARHRLSVLRRSEPPMQIIKLCKRTCQHIVGTLFDEMQSATPSTHHA